MEKHEKFTGNNSIFACRLKELMENQRITQLQLAKELNMTRQAVSLYLTGRSIPDINKLLIICDFFNVSSDFLLGISYPKSDELVEFEANLNEILNPQKNNYNIATATEKACVMPVIKTVARRGRDTKENPLRYVTQYWSLNGELLAEKEDPI